MMPTPAAIDVLREHAQQRAQNARDAVEEAIRDLRERKQPVNIHAVARHAGVSRRMIYNHPDLRDEIRMSSSRPQLTGAAPSEENNTIVTALRNELAAQKNDYERTIAQLQAELREQTSALASAHEELQRIRAGTGDRTDDER